MKTMIPNIQDAMQVCRHGHVITDRLHHCPELARTHCDRCGAVTVDRCSTCGRELPGAVVVPGLQPIGVRRPPAYCSTCGAAFPWTKSYSQAKSPALSVLETTLRRLPLVIRQLRVRHDNRPPFRVVDEKDLEDLLRSFLPLHFDDIRPECRTPRYAAGTRTDFLLAAESIAVTLKFAQPCLAESFREDAEYYRKAKKCRIVSEFVYDPEGRIREPQSLQAICATLSDEMEIRCVIATP